MVNQMIRIPRGCVLWFDLTEDTGNIVYDHSGHGNNGKVYGAVLEKRLPFIGRRFDGVDDYVEVPDSDSLKPCELTISAWILRKGPGTGNYGGIVAKYDILGGYLLAMHEPSNKIGFWIRKDNSYFKSIYSDITLDEIENKWTHVVAVFDGDKLMMWVNRVKQSQEASGGILINRPLNLYIGHYGSSFTNGNIAHVSIYNRALTTKEIKYLYEEMQKRIFRRIAPLEIRMR